MKIIEMETEKLIPYERNAKIHDDTQISDVAESIKQFGWKQPIVIDKDNVVVIGHCRLLAAKKLGLRKVPVTVADDLSEEQVRKLRIADNKTNESGWDSDLLRDELDGLDFDGFDFEFDIPELNEIEVPESFKEYGENIEVKSKCPRCGYEW